MRQADDGEQFGAVFDKFADVGKGWIVEDAFGEDDAEFSAGYEEVQTAFDEEDFGLDFAELALAVFG